MTAEIINLRRARKTKARAAKATEADHNRAKFGRTKADRATAALEAARAARHLDGARVSPEAANEAGFPTVAAHDDDDLDPGNVS